MVAHIQGLSSVVGGIALMEKNELIIFKKCTDAPGTTRGFVYQYLKTLIVWLNNYRNGENISIFCEVDDDIKEINEVKKTIRFTQLKCYSNVLGINSEEIKKSLYNFFVLSILHEDYAVECCFETNTHISKRDKLIDKWVQYQENLSSNNKLQMECVTTVKKILLEVLSIEQSIYRKPKEKQLKKKVEKLSEAPESIDLLEEVSGIQKILKGYERKMELMEKKIHDEKIILNFVNRIRWRFDGVESSYSIEHLKSEINMILNDITKKNENAELYLHRLLSEINFTTIKEDKEARILTKELLDSIFEETDAIIHSHIDNSFIEEFNNLEKIITNGFSEVMQKVSSSEDRLSDKIDGLKKTITNGFVNQQEKETIVYEMPPINEEKVETYLRHEKKQYQSNLEYKFSKIKGIPDGVKRTLLYTATTARCRYLMYMDDLAKKNLQEEYDEVKKLEHKVQRICTKAVLGFSCNRDIPPAFFYMEFHNELDDVLRSFNENLTFKGIKIEEETVYGQMFHMAANCYLQWHREEEE
ncbi:TPA: hypothetical protein ROY08_002037 [Bacillus cereus]|nr:hypothetical protein [Bacillus cereus]